MLLLILKAKYNIRASLAAQDALQPAGGALMLPRTSLSVIRTKEVRKSQLKDMHECTYSLILDDTDTLDNNEEATARDKDYFFALITTVRLTTDMGNEKCIFYIYNCCFGVFF